MSKLPTFPMFSAYVCEGDTVEVEHNGITYRARIERDDVSDKPDERQDGFWPSLNPDSDGFIGSKSPRTLARHMARARAVMAAWEADEWFYCGVVVAAFIVDDEGDETALTDGYGAALWGVECNYPERSRRGYAKRNAYLSEVAGESLSEAVKEAEEARAKLHALTAPREVAA